MRIFTKRRAGLIGLALATSLAFTAVAHAVTWGPARPTFTWANPASYITFNSITDNPSVGDERTFLTVKDASSSGPVQGSVNVHDNEELIFRVYFHNNAASNLNLVAHNTRVKILLPHTASTSTYAAGYISADNANPVVVAATADLTGSSPFTVEYEAGTAQLWNGVFRGAQLNDSIVTTTGAQVGYNAIDGNVPGCSEFSGFVTIKVRVHMPTTPQAQFSCTGLDVNQVDRTRFDFTAHGSATNATIQSYGFTAKDSNSNTVDSQTVNTSATSAVYHFNQPNAGTYTVSAIVNTDHGSTSPSATCTKQVTVVAPPTTPPPATPPPVTPTSVGKEIPNTGAGSTIALFSGVSALAGIGHFVFRRVRG